MKLTFSTNETTVSIEREGDDWALDDVLEMIESMLMAAGYAVAYDTLTVTRPTVGTSAQVPTDGSHE